MLPRLILLFTVTPLVELAILLHLGTRIGVWYTVLIVVLTGVVGAFLARKQGLEVLSRIRRDTEQGILPGQELLHGALILAGGLLLLTPGLLTDAVGFAFLIPATRRRTMRWLRRIIERRMQQGQIQYWHVR